MSERGAGHLLALILVACGLVLVATGSAWWALAPPAQEPTLAGRALPAPPVLVVPGVAFAPSAAGRPVPATPAVPALGAGTPERIDVPALGIDVPVLPIHAVGDALEPPSDPFELGWWADGPEPGQAGVTLVTGHTVHNGPGALNDLGRLRPGDLVSVRTSASLITYRVTGVRTFLKGALAQRSQQLFASDGPSRLALVTCSAWDGHEYLSNVVVDALPVGG